MKKKITIEKTLSILLGFVAASLVVILIPSTSHAALYGGGGGSVNRDWEKHKQLSTSTSSKRNLTVLWQGILFADGYFPNGWVTKTVRGNNHPCGNTRFYGGGEVDGGFGNRTKCATRAWQLDHGLSADGIVGPKTWTKAENMLWHHYYASSTGGYQHLFYKNYGISGAPFYIKRWEGWGITRLKSVSKGNCSIQFKGDTAIYDYKFTMKDGILASSGC